MTEYVILACSGCRELVDYCSRCGLPFCHDDEVHCYDGHVCDNCHIKNSSD